MLNEATIWDIRETMDEITRLDESINILYSELDSIRVKDESYILETKRRIASFLLEQNRLIGYIEHTYEIPIKRNYISYPPRKRKVG